MTDTVRAAVPQRRSPAALLRDMPTGAKVFLILGAALLPLALLAFLASLQTTRVADQETRARLRVAASESARALSIELLGDIGALRVALDTLRGDPGLIGACRALIRLHRLDDPRAERTRAPDAFEDALSRRLRDYGRSATAGSRRAQARTARSIGSSRSPEKVSAPARRILAAASPPARSTLSSTSSVLSRSQVSSIASSSASRSANAP